MPRRTVGSSLLNCPIWRVVRSHGKRIGLYLNVVRPAGVSVGANLPVIVVSYLSVVLEMMNLT